MSMALEPPEECHSMADIRNQIDKIDADLVDLFVLRSRYIDRAVIIKRRDDLPARIETRVEDVVEKVKTRAARSGFDQELVETLWRLLIEWSIAREAKELGEAYRLASPHGRSGDIPREARPADEDLEDARPQAL